MNRKYVVRAEAGKGWRVFNRRTRRWWGEWYRTQPDALLIELNGEKRPTELVRLVRELQRGRV